VSREIYDVVYAENRTVVVLRGDLGRGWGRLEKSFGFFHTNWIWYKNDFHVRTQLCALIQPATVQEFAHNFPDINFQVGDELTSFSVERKTLEARIRLSPRQPWRLMMGKRPGLFLEQLGVQIGVPGYWLDLRAWLIFHPEDKSVVPDVRVWCEKHLVPGGQFESNRRRH